jgi:hypothetical protein
MPSRSKKIRYRALFSLRIILLWVRQSPNRVIVFLLSGRLTIYKALNKQQSIYPAFCSLYANKKMLWPKFEKKKLPGRRLNGNP